MFSLETTLFSLLLVAVSGVLVWRHKSVWTVAENEEQDEAYRKFLHNQCRRRLQASGMIGVIGVAMFMGQFLDPWPLVKVFYWGGVMLLVLWVILLAMADLFVSRYYFGRQRRSQLLAAMQYYAEFNRGDGEDAKGDGQSDETPS